MQLRRGENAAVNGRSLSVEVRGPGVDVLAFQVDDRRRVRSDADFVFFNQPRSPEGAVVLAGPSNVTIDLNAVPADVDMIVIAVVVEEGRGSGLAEVPGLAAAVGGTGEPIDIPAAGLTTERAAVMVEVYRRAGAWKVRSVSAGWAEGFASLVREFGVSVDDAPPPSGQTNPVAGQSPSAGPRNDLPRSVPGEERLSLEKRQRLDMRKQAVHAVLLTKNAVGERARIVVVIDKTLSMTALYKKRVIHRVVERMVPVATQIDDDGNLEPYLYAKWFAKLPDISVAGLDTWLDDWLHLKGRHGGIDYNRDIGGVNAELPILNEIITSAEGVVGPTLVLFFTDGGFHSRRGEIRQVIRQAAAMPIFWQFVGLGNADYGMLRELDALEGRTVDNAGFFSVDDIDKISDGELYARLLSEFPDWLKAARSAGVLT